MVDAKRVIEKYKAQEEEEKKTQETLRAEIVQLKADGAGAGGGGGEGGGGQQAAKMEELEMQVAQLKMNLAAAAEEADTSKSKLEKFKAAASEKMKQDRARYLEHLQSIKDGAAVSEDPVADTPLEATEEEEGPDIEIPQAVTQVSQEGEERREKR